jgi:hypothetical protein
MNLIKYKRKLKFLYQRWIRGWDDSETWDLDVQMLKFVLPRLKRFIELNNAIPSKFIVKYPHINSSCQLEEYNKILYEIVWMCENYDNEYKLKGDDINRMQLAKSYFAEYWEHLTW